jgi:hypothetical protein
MRALTHVLYPRIWDVVILSDRERGDTHRSVTSQAGITRALLKYFRECLFSSSLPEGNPRSEKAG